MPNRVTTARATTPQSPGAPPRRTATARAGAARAARPAPAAVALALAGLLASAGCSGGSSTGSPEAGAVTAVPAALSPSASASGPSASATLLSPSPTTPSSPSGTSAGPTALPLTPDVTARLDTAVQRVLTEASVPGVIVNLSTPQGEYLKAFGVSDKVAGTAMVTGLNMRIGSETKTFTVTGLLRLVDQGKAGLDDPIGKYIAGVPNGDTITLRQLSDMRSGLFSYTQDEDFVSALQADPQRSFTPDQLLAYAFKHPVNFAPGAEFDYSNTNTVLIGKVIEKLGGRPLGDFLKKEVFDPADLGRTVFPTTNAFPQPHSRGYTNQTADGTIADATDWNPSWGWAAGAMISDQADMKKWAKVLATGTLLTPQTQAQRLQPQPSAVPDTWYGLGVFYNHGWIGHNGSLPGYQTVVVYLPSAQASLVVLLNTDITYKGSAPSTLFAKAITEVVSPGNVYDLPAAPAGGDEPSATADASVSTSVTPPAPSTA
ncbi:serine hydrolase domain-containing protein [Kitasatospora purpeofusca]|uniref:serine hydrolase domain-containing protein n=1 Tax=Kitasatospora purpeofusca TaxID=67352 RepID=UPI002258097C|nr:serine hydrolase domain-containing protein [Kitasatospora purpeofusca]MCX4759080.1 beta-lactamase family protein [Kitasatospora purpeofusca]WSR30506.1 beta-lactamase family protein [Kitasatospora purpeofusca]WSR38745.1 beta-lactamase family protein [Kitasatospora purpeofusca]